MNDRPTLRTALACAHEIICEQRHAMSWIVRVMALGLLLAGQERERARSQAREMARRLGDAAIDAMRTRRALTVALSTLDRAADRFVLAEYAISKVRASVAELRTAATTGKRADVLAVVAKLEDALR